jgi:glycosyltransferase involved in cell wall biosynthesis
MAMKVGVSIVALNRPETLKQTLEALEKTLPPDITVVIVDNGSSIPATTAENTWCILRNATNLGLSRAVNQGLAELYRQGCDLLIHLDDDALIKSPAGWVEELVKIFERNPELGLLLPNPTWYTEFIPHGEYNELRWGLGFAWILRRATYDLTGGYDTQILHQQEADLAIRVRMADYTVGVVPWEVAHNDPGGEKSELFSAREHIGVVQFVDKWTQYFRGRGWSYGTVPVYRMQQWPPDQEWYRRFSKASGIELNPAPPEYRVENVLPGERVIEIIEVSEQGKIVGNALARRIMIGDTWYFCFVELRNEYAHWARGTGYLDDRDRAIAKWFELSGEKYEGYRWPDILKCI